MTRPKPNPNPFPFSTVLSKPKKCRRNIRQVFGRGLVPQLPKKHECLKEFCIFTAPTRNPALLEEAMIEASIPYQIVGGLKFYERKEIKDMLAYLRLALNFRIWCRSSA